MINNIDLTKYTEKIFEDIKHIDDSDNEYWYARELQQVLEYKEWRRFERAINKAKSTCKNSNIEVLEQLVGADKLIKHGKGGTRNIADYRLSRYACYLITKNGDFRKKVIALAQTYFAIQIRTIRNRV